MTTEEHTYEVPVIVTVQVTVRGDETTVEGAYVDNDGAPWAYSADPTAFDPVTGEWHQGWSEDEDYVAAWHAAYDGLTVKPKPETTDEEDRILWNERGHDIDEVLLHDVTVHIEQMHDRGWWIGLYEDDDHYWMGNFTADSRGRMRFTEQDNAGVTWDRDETHEGGAS